MIERWAAIPGYEGLYEVSNLGAIRGTKRRGTSGASLRLTKDKNGYTKVNLYQNCQRKGFWLHSLMLTAFVGPRPPGMQACHNDGDRGHNHLDNLRWDTATANYDDARSHGTAAIGEKNAAAKLSQADREQIRALRAAGVTQKAVGQRFGVCQQTISDFERGRYYAR